MHIAHCKLYIVLRLSVNYTTVCKQMINNESIIESAVLIKILVCWSAVATGCEHMNIAVLHTADLTFRIDENVIYLLCACGSGAAVSKIKSRLEAC